MRKSLFFVLCSLFFSTAGAQTIVADSDSVKSVVQEYNINPASVVDEVVWVVGDEPILKSEIEVTRLQEILMADGAIMPTAAFLSR